MKCCLRLYWFAEQEMTVGTAAMLNFFSINFIIYYWKRWTKTIGDLFWSEILISCHNTIPYNGTPVVSGKQ